MAAKKRHRVVVGDRIRAIRERKKMSQERLAERADLHYNYPTMPPAEHLLALWAWVARPPAHAMSQWLARLRLFVPSLKAQREAWGREA